MKRYLPILLSIAALFIAALSAAGQAGAGVLRQVGVQDGAPTVISYQGLVTTGGSAYTGTGYFKFAVVANDGQTTWSNDGTSVSGSEPSASVPLPVTNGLFTVLLGDTSLGMSQMTYIAFAKPDTSLRVWFSIVDGGFQRLEPDRRIAAVPYAMQAEIAKQADMVGGYPSSQLATLGHKHAGQDIYTGTVSAAYIQDGPGSTLDADLLDGQQGASFVTLAGSQTITGAKTFSPASGAPFSVTSPTLVSNLNADQVDGLHAAALRSVVAVSTYGQLANLTSSCQDYTSITITTPGAGVVIVEANAYVTLMDSVFSVLALSDSPGSADCNSTATHLTRWETAPPGFLGSNYFLRLSLRVQRAFNVGAAGTYTYYLSGKATDPAAAVNQWHGADLLANYYP